MGVKSMSTEMEDGNGNKINSRLSEKINEVELQATKDLAEIKQILTRMETNLNYVTKELIKVEANYVTQAELKRIEDKQIDHEKRIRFVERSVYIGTTVIFIIILLKDTIIRVLTN